MPTDDGGERRVDFTTPAPSLPNLYPGEQLHASSRYVVRRQEFACSSKNGHPTSIVDKITRCALCSTGYSFELQYWGSSRVIPRCWDVVACRATEYVTVSPLDRRSKLLSWFWVDLHSQDGEDGWSIRTRDLSTVGPMDHSVCVYVYI